MYSLSAILNKQPVAIASALRSVLFVMILAGLIVMDEKLLSSIALGAEIVLNLFVWNAVTPNATAAANEAQAFADGANAGAKALESDITAGSPDSAHVQVDDMPSTEGQG